MACNHCEMRLRCDPLCSVMPFYVPLFMFRTSAQAVSAALIHCTSRPRRVSALYKYTPVFLHAAQYCSHIPSEPQHVPITSAYINDQYQSNDFQSSMKRRAPGAGEPKFSIAYRSNLPDTREILQQIGGVHESSSTLWLQVVMMFVGRSQNEVAMARAWIIIWTMLFNLHFTFILLRCPSPPSTDEGSCLVVLPCSTSQAFVTCW